MSKETNKSPEDKKRDGRRDFLVKAGIAGAAVALGGTALFTAFDYEKKKGKKHKVLTADGKIAEVSEEDLASVQIDFADRGREGLAGKRFVMVIDLAKCKNARACIHACQSHHELRPHQYHINTLEMQEGPNTPRYYMPKPCQHCDNPPCVAVCPVDATYKRQDGIVLIDNERCIGCRFCMAACPYSARIFNWEEPYVAAEDPATGEPREYDVELNVPQKKGTISKCLFSADRLREGKLPYCVSACPNGVYWFGDENEDVVTNGTTKESVRFSQLLEENGAYRLMEELGTKPRVYYLPPKGRTEEGIPPEHVDEHHS